MFAVGPLVGEVQSVAGSVGAAADRPGRRPRGEGDFRVRTTGDDRDVRVGRVEREVVPVRHEAVETVARDDAPGGPTPSE